MNAIAVEIYTGNTDLLNNKKYRSTAVDGKWRWIVFDFDWAFYTDTNSVGRWLKPGGVGIYESSLHDAIGANPLLPVYTKDAQGNVTGFYDEAAKEAAGWNFFSDAKHPIGLDYYNRGRNLGCV